MEYKENRNSMQKNRTLFFLSLIIFISFFSHSLFAQEIQTAQNFFKSISEYYANIMDYEADMEITAGSQNMSAKVSFKKPNLLRIDFSRPETQVILFNGNLLTIYLPGSSSVLTQSVSKDSGAAGGANLATPQGLNLMSRYYLISYEEKNTAVTLDDLEKNPNGSSEMVIKLLLSRRNASEGFRNIVLSINPTTKLIRRVEATTPANETFRFTFYNYALNQNIPDARFIYDSPGTANTYNNFLFTE